MLSEREVTAAIGSTAYGDGGDKLGTVEHFFVDDRTGEPTWVAVTTGLFGTRHSVVPAREAVWDDGTLRLPVSAEAVKNAPAMNGNHLDPGEEAELRRHYGLEGGRHRDADEHRDTDLHRETDRDAVVPPAGPTDTVAVPAVPPPPAAGTATGTADASTNAATDGSMIRSEERLRVGTEQVAATRVRLVKYVVTENVEVTVPIRREEIRLEEIPLDADDDTGAVGGESLVPHGNAPTAAAGLPEDIVLHSERPVISLEVVPVERVRLRTDLVQDQETVTERVQRERIVLEEDSPRG